MFNLQEATADHHAISWGWVKDNTVLKSGNNTVSNGWKIQSDQKSHFHVEGGETKIYWLQDPSHAQHPVTMGWADNKYAQRKPQQLFAGGRWHADRQSSVLRWRELTAITARSCNRSCFELRATSDKPIIFSSGSGARAAFVLRLRQRGSRQKE